MHIHPKTRWFQSYLELQVYPQQRTRDWGMHIDEPSQLLTRIGQDTVMVITSLI